MMSIKQIPVSNLFFKNFCYLVTDTNDKVSILIDPAWEKDKIIECINESNSTVAGILLTHSHIDHTNLSNYFSLKYNCPIFISKIESDYYKFYCNKMNLIVESNIFFINNIAVKPILTPGHTMGSLCYLIENYLFTGDTLFIEGCGGCFGNGSDPEKMYHSLNYLKKNISDDILVYSGHSYGMKQGQKFKNLLNNNVYLNINDLELFVKFRMRKK